MLRTGFILFLFIGHLCAQLPETDLWLFKIKTEKEVLKIAEGKNITNRKGYDNQPCFAPDGKSLLYVSVREDNQSDVYKYEISKELSIQLTKTKESEYSPNFRLGNGHISCVVVEADSTQRLWLYNPDGSVNKCYNESIDSIGYYSWYTNDTLLYYKLTEPHSLRMYLDAVKEDKWICDHPSRAFRRTSGNYFVYAIKDSVSIQYRKYNTLLKKSELFAEHKSKSEDFIWNHTLGLLKSEGTQILQYDEKEKRWITLFDLSSFGIKKITRFTFDQKNKKLAIVDNS